MNIFLVSIPLTFMSHPGRSVDEIYHCIFLEKEMHEGIFNVVFEGVGPSSDCGLAHKSKVSKILRDFYTVAGSCSINHLGMECGEECVAEKLFNARMHNLMLELHLKKDGSGGMLHIFVDEKQIPHTIIKIPRSVYFYYIYHRKNPFKVRSFCQVAAPTRDWRLHCCEYEWR